MVLRYADPIVVWLDPKRPDFGVKLIETVPDSLMALHRHGLGEALHGKMSGLWREAAAALVRAEVEPSPSNMQRAHDAFLKLVKRIAPVPARKRLRVSRRGLREEFEAILKV